MTRLFLTLITLFLVGQGFSQKLGNPEKFGKGILQTLADENAKKFKKFALSEKDFNSIIELEKLDTNIVNSIPYSEVVDRYDSTYSRLILNLNDAGIVPENITFQNITYQIIKGQKEVTGEFIIVFTDGDKPDRFLLNLSDCLFYNGKWILGSTISLQTYIIDRELLCQCLDGTRPVESPECVELMKKGEESFNSMDKSQQAEIRAIIEECYSEETLDAAERELEEREAEEELMPLDYPDEQLDEYQAKLEVIIPGICNCSRFLDPSNEDDTGKAECEEQLISIRNLFSDPELNLDDGEVFLAVIKRCAEKSKEE